MIRAILAALIVVGSAWSASAELLDPRNGRPFVVHDMSGKIVERLQPAPDGFVRRDLVGRRLGRAALGANGRLTFYDTTGRIIGLARRDEPAPPSQRLQTLAVIRSPTGQPLGIIAAR